MSDAAQPKLNPFSLITALSDAADYVFGGFLQLVRLSWVYFLFVCATAALLFILIGLLAAREMETGVYVVIGIGLLLGFLVSNAYYILIIRNWLLGEERPRVLPVYGIFILRVIVLSLIVIAAIAAVFVPIFVAGIAGASLFDDGQSEPPVWIIVLAIVALIALVIVALLAALYLAGRLSPWFVAAAAGHPLTLRDSWRATQGAGIRIAAGMLALTILFAVLDVMIETALSPILGINSEAFEKIATGASLPALYVIVLAKVAVFFPQAAASMIFCASIFRQTTSGR
jgi:hypothetical protein